MGLEARRAPGAIVSTYRSAGGHTVTFDDHWNYVVRAHGTTERSRGSAAGIGVGPLAAARLLRAHGLNWERVVEVKA